MKVATIGTFGLLMLAGVLSAQKAHSLSVRTSETFTGEITDSLCAEGHQIGFLNSEKNCVITCVKVDGAEFELYNSQMNHIYKLSDQIQPEVYAGQEVIVTGNYEKETNSIHVISIRPRITYAGL
jgi:hypothetical protein